MKELSITVMLEGASDASYRFLDSPVLIGRSPQCDLCICHEAVPRELCLTWLEDDGDTVRVEERPGLTNQLLSGKSIVKGGQSGSSVEVSVGPLKLRLEPASEVGQIGEKRVIGRSKFLFIATAGLVALVFLMLINSRKSGDPSPGGPHLLPASPFCSSDSVVCESQSSCAEKARLYVTRARELLSRPKKRPADQVRAATMLGVASKIYREANDPKSDEIGREAEKQISRIIIEYQKDSMVLKRKQEDRHPPDEATIEAASRVHQYLENCQGPWQEWLERLCSLSPGKRSMQNGE